MLQDERKKKTGNPTRVVAKFRSKSQIHSGSTFTGPYELPVGIKIVLLGTSEIYNSLIALIMSFSLEELIFGKIAARQTINSG
jgi:hypothetical protein